MVRTVVTDSNVTLEVALRAFRNGDREAACHALLDLLDYISSGGTMPNDPGVALEYGVARVTAKHLRAASAALLVHAASCDRLAEGMNTPNQG